MKIALAFARRPVDLNTRHRFLPARLDCVVLGSLIEPEPAITVMIVVAAALVAVQGAAIVYITVATPDVEKITYAKGPLRPPA